jgi:hypothetical protein
MALIQTRALLLGFNLRTPTINPLANQQGQVVGTLVEASKFEPRIGLYTGEGFTNYRGTATYTFGGTREDPVAGLHKGMPSKGEFFTREVGGQKVADIVQLFKATSAALLDDTPDGKGVAGTITLKYSVDGIEVNLMPHDKASSIVTIEMGIYENGGTQKLGTYYLQYVPDALVAAKKLSAINVRDGLAKVREDVSKVHAQITALGVVTGDRDKELELQAHGQNLEQLRNRYIDLSRQEASSRDVAYFPLSQLWQEAGVVEATAALASATYAQLKESTYLMADYDMDNLASLEETRAMLQSFATL